MSAMGSALHDDISSTQRRRRNTIGSGHFVAPRGEVLRERPAQVPINSSNEHAHGKGSSQVEHGRAHGGEQTARAENRRISPTLQALQIGIHHHPHKSAKIDRRFPAEDAPRLPASPIR